MKEKEYFHIRLDVLIYLWMNATVYLLLIIGLIKVAATDREILQGVRSVGV